MTAPRRAAAGRPERILRLLDQERETLLRGPVGALAGLVARREALVAELAADLAAKIDAAIDAGTDAGRAAATTSPEGPLAEILAEIRARAGRNGRLIAAAIAGVKAAAAEVARIDAARGVLRTYSAEGAPVEVAGARVTRDTRA